MLSESIITPQSLFYVVLTIIFFCYWIFTFILFYHLTRFGIGTFPKKIATIFLLGSVLFFCIAFLFFASVDLNVLKNILETFINSVFNVNN